VEAAFAEVFPCRLGRVRSSCGSPSRLVWLMERAALKAVLVAWGLPADLLGHYVHAKPAVGNFVTFVKRLDGQKYLGP
jgi:hypothetical protein